MQELEIISSSSSSFAFPVARHELGGFYVKWQSSNVSFVGYAVICRLGSILLSEY
jgi:hypothetical protein